MEDDLPDLPYLQRASGKNLIKSPNDLLSMDYLQDEEIAQFDLETLQQSDFANKSYELSRKKGIKTKNIVPVNSRVAPIEVEQKYVENNVKIKPSKTKEGSRLRRTKSERNIVEYTKTSPLHPNSKFRAKWDVVMIVMLFYTAIMVPYEIAFLSEGEKSIDFMFVVNRIVDCTFLMDMIFNFFTPYIGPVSGQMIYDKSSIFWHYASGWFPIDLISILPFDVLGLLVESNAVGQLKIIRIIRLLRLMKLARVLRASRIFSRWESELGLTYAVLKLLKFICGVMLLGHWMACVWGGVVLFEDLEEGELTWIQSQGLAINPKVRYIAALYWAVMTLTTIGYGDVIPQTTEERMVCILCMMIGGGVYAYVVGAVCGIVASMDEATTEFNQQMDHLNVYMDKVKAPKKMRIKLRNYILHSKDFLQHKYFSRVVSILSPGLRGQFAVHTNGVWVRKVNFFTGGPSDEDIRFVVAITQKMQAELFPPQEAIISVGDPTNKMYIVSKGLVARLGRVMGKDNIFGEDVILSHGTRHYSVLTLTYVDVYSLSRRDLDCVLKKNFPHKAKSIRRAAVFLALKRKLQYLHTELMGLRAVGSKNITFQRNWIRARLLGNESKNRADPRDRAISVALVATAKARDSIEEGMACVEPLPNRDSAFAAHTLIKSALSLLERCKSDHT